MDRQLSCTDAERDAIIEALAAQDHTLFARTAPLIEAGGWDLEWLQHVLTTALPYNLPAAQLLAKIGSPAIVPALREAVEVSGGAATGENALALWALGRDPEAIARLRKMALHTLEPNARVAIAALAKIDDLSARAALTECATSHPVASIAHLAQEVLSGNEERGMDSNWPDFTDERLDAQRTWSARFDSYNQRTDDVYYRVTIKDGGSEGAPFMVEAGVAWLGDLQGPQFVEKLRGQIRDLAAAGKANTDYEGPVLRRT